MIRIVLTREWSELYEAVSTVDLFMRDTLRQIENEMDDRRFVHNVDWCLDLSTRRFPQIDRALRVLRPILDDNAVVGHYENGRPVLLRQLAHIERPNILEGFDVSASELNYDVMWHRENLRHFQRLKDRWLQVCAHKVAAHDRRELRKFTRSVARR